MDKDEMENELDDGGVILGRYLLRHVMEDFWQIDDTQSERVLGMTDLELGAVLHEYFEKVHQSPESRAIVADPAPVVEKVTLDNKDWYIVHSVLPSAPKVMIFSTLSSDTARTLLKYVSDALKAKP